MGSQVTLPLWAVIIVIVLAGLAVIDRILMTSVRWALRGRANRAIDELNTRLRLHIQPLEAVLSSPMAYRAVTVPKPPPRRVTLGYGALAAAREVWC